MTKLYIASQYLNPHQNTTGLYFSTIIKHFKNIYPTLEVISSEPIFTFLNKEDSYFSQSSSKNKLKKRVYSQFVISLRLLIKIIAKLRRGDVLITGTNPTLLLPIITLLKNIIGFKWCLVLHDVFPDNALAAGILKKNSFLYKVTYRVYSWVYNSPDKVIVIGRDMAEIIAKKHVSPEKINFIANWASPEEVTNVSKIDSSLIKDLNWENKIVFQFFGNIGRLQAIDYILDAIALTKNNNLAFLFIGSGASVDKLKLFIANNPSKNIHYYGPLPLELKNEGLASCDIAFVSLEPEMTGLGVPSKSYFSMAADKPILAIMDKDAEISRVVIEEGIGWICTTHDSATLASLMDSITFSDILALKGKPRKVLIDKYSQDCAMQKYVKCILPLINSDKS